MASKQDALISAQTVFGAYHALESLSQLVFFDTASEQFMLHGAPWSIEDAPAYPVILGIP